MPSGSLPLCPAAMLPPLRAHQRAESCLSAAAASSLTADTLVPPEWEPSEEDQRENRGSGDTVPGLAHLHDSYKKKKKNRERDARSSFDLDNSKRSFLRDSSDFGVNWSPHAGQPVYQIVSSAPLIRDKATSVMRKDGAPETHRGSQRRGLNFIKLVLMPAAADIVWFFLFNLTV